MLAQALAFKQLGDDVRRAVMGADVEEREDVGMVECRRGARLLFKTAQAFRVGRERERQYLDCHVPPEARIVRATDLAHTAGADGRHNFIRPEANTGTEGHVGQFLGERPFSWSIALTGVVVWIGLVIFSVSLIGRKQP